MSRLNALVIGIIVVAAGWGIWNSRITPQSIHRGSRPHISQARAPRPVAPAVQALPTDAPPNLRVSDAYWQAIANKEVVKIDDGRGHVVWQGTPGQFRTVIDSINALAARAGSTDTVDLAGQEYRPDSAEIIPQTEADSFLIGK